jgi:hypothetical protein
MTLRFVAAALGLVALAGCLSIDVRETVVDSDAPNLPRGGAETCNAGDYQFLVGQNERHIDRRIMPRTFRIVCHECNVTMDYNPNRLNIQLDANNKVASVKCG